MVDGKMKDEFAPIRGGDEAGKVAADLPRDVIERRQRMRCEQRFAAAP